MPVTDVNNLKVADLKRELKERGLSVAGNKNELQDRLQAAMIDGETLLEDSSIVGEDILDEEEGVLSDEEKILGSDENELLKSPTPTTLPKLNTENNAVALADDEILESPTTTAKKIVLKRKISINNGTSTNETSNTTKENTEPPEPKTLKASERNPITMGDAKASATKKFSEMSMQERLELRAKKFGIDSAAVAAAAATPATTAIKDKTAISQAPVVSSEKQVELLKKRAERFGCVTSTNLVKLDAEERRLKRMQRFGGETDATATKPDGPVTMTTDEWAEKARKRLDRFGGATTTTTASTPVAAPVVTSTTPVVAPTAAASN